MRLLILTVTGMLLTATLSAQMLTGRIVNTEGQPVPHATFYIRELTLGLIADEQGEFRAKIDRGEYTCEVSSLGYERKVVTISVPEGGLALETVLQEKTYAIREVLVTPGKEDPAYRIMRKVISRAPYHLHQVKSYEAGVYLKGSFKIDKIPALLKMQINDKKLKEMTGTMYVLESQNEVRYHEPDKYEQRVVALSNTIPGDFHIDDNVMLSVITGNIYSPSAFSGLLAPGSFSIYKFRLEDSYNENGHAIHKIQVLPKKKNGQLAGGTLYVVDDNYTVQQADLSLSPTGTTIRYKLTYHEIKPGAFLPTAFDIAINISVMGVKGSGQFYASIKYNNLETNDNHIPTVQNAATVPERSSSDAGAAVPKKRQKELAQLEKLMDKEELTTRESYQMAKLMKKTVEPEAVREQRRNLELRSELDSLIIVTRDSLALRRDSAYWAEHRNLPLRDEELRSYILRDSIRRTSDSRENADSLKKRTAATWTTGLLFGEKINTGKKTYFRYGGLLLACPEYNFVDGFRIGQRIEAGINFDKNRSLSISPAIYYTTARREADITADGVLTYAPMRNAKLAVSAGNTTADFAGDNGTDRFGNTLGSFFFALNAAKFYQKRYLSLSNEIDIANGLILHTGINYEKRNDLENNTSYNLFQRTPASNRPHGQTDIMPAHEALTADITLEYTPRYYYIIRNGRKFYRKSAYPTLRLNYAGAFGSKSNSSFDKIEATVSQNIRLNLFDHLFYELNAGTFLSAGQTRLPDFKHFRTNELFLSGKSLNNSFRMDNYRYATNDKWLQAHAAYSSDYLLLKHLPFLQRYLFNESLHLRTLWLPHLTHSEAGYSIGFGEMGRIGIFAGFDGLKYESTGITVSIPLLNTLVK
ncbi:MAG: DUF5686 and carboxypeptidase regulatory-like domain-containing protein [Tannerella sp.]|jgi:hypothetical protein|nr:DUF5686 and carboxypeptidase regulatory-like domain-containing protein [Tannerella sp.]